MFDRLFSIVSLLENIYVICFQQHERLFVKEKKRGAVFFFLFQLSDICYTSECISGHLAISLSLMLRINIIKI